MKTKILMITLMLMKCWLQVYMCFCKGDLCNPGTRPQAPAWLLAVSLAAVVAVLGR